MGNFWRACRTAQGSRDHANVERSRTLGAECRGLLPRTYVWHGRGEHFKVVIFGMLNHKQHKKESQVSRQDCDKDFSPLSRGPRYESPLSRSNNFSRDGAVPNNSPTAGLSLMVVGWLLFAAGALLRRCFPAYGNVSRPALGGLIFARLTRELEGDRALWIFRCDAGGIRIGNDRRNLRCISALLAIIFLRLIKVIVARYFMNAGDGDRQPRQT